MSETASELGKRVPPKPTGAQSLVCRYCHHTLAKAVICGREPCPNPDLPHYHCLWPKCDGECSVTGSCEPVDREE